MNFGFARAEDSPGLHCTTVSRTEHYDSTTEIAVKCKLSVDEAVLICEGTFGAGKGCKSVGVQRQSLCCAAPCGIINRPTQQIRSHTVQCMLLFSFVARLNGHVELQTRYQNASSTI